MKLTAGLLYRGGLHHTNAYSALGFSLRNAQESQFFRHYTWMPSLLFQSVTDNNRCIYRYHPSSTAQCRETQFFQVVYLPLLLLLVFIVFWAVYSTPSYTTPPTEVARRQFTYHHLAYNGNSARPCAVMHTAIITIMVICNRGVKQHPLVLLLGSCLHHDAAYRLADGFVSALILNFGFIRPALFSTSMKKTKKYSRVNCKPFF